MFKKFLSYGVGVIGSALISLAVIPILTRVLSPAEYGKGSMYIVFITFLFYLCSFGMDQAFVRFFFEKEGVAARTRLLLQCSFYVMIGCVVVSIFLFLLYPFSLNIFFNNATSTLFLMAIFGLFSFSINRFVLLNIRMHQKAFLYSLGLILTNALYFLFILVLIKFFNMHIFYVMVIAKSASLFFSSFLLLLFGKLFEFDKAAMQAFFSLGELKELLSYGWPYIFGFLLMWGMQSLDRVFVLHFSSYTELGLYSAAFSLVTPLIFMQSIFCTLWVPIMNKKLLESPRESKPFFRLVYFLLLTSFMLLLVLVLLFGGYIVMFLGVKFRSALKIFPMLLFLPVFYSLTEITQAGILLSKKTYLNLWGMFFGLISNVILCVILVPKFGALGAGVSICFAYFVYFIVRSSISLRIYDFQVRLWYSIVFFCCVFVLLFLERSSTHVLQGLSLLMLFVTMYFRDIVTVFKRLKVLYD